MNAFVTHLDPDLLAQIRQSPWASVDFETTALSLSSPPTRLGSGQKIGGEYTATAYQRHYGAGIDCRPRARIWSIQIDSGVKIAFDLDGLEKSEIVELVHASMDGKAVIGHNLGFDFGWALAYAPLIKPAKVVDLMLLVRCMRPGAPWRVHAQAADPANLMARDLVEKRNEASAALNSLCVAYGLPVLEKQYQKPHNWCVKHLSAGHLDYCLGDIDAPVEILKKIAGASTLEEALVKLEAEDSESNGGIYFGLYQHAPLALAQMSRRGLPLHRPTLDAIRKDRAARVQRLLPELYKHMPAMLDHAVRLDASKLGVSAEMKQVLAAYAESHGCTLDIGDDGNPIIQRKKAALTGATKLAGWVVWDELQRCKKILSLCTEYEDYSLDAGEFWRRLHPLIGAVTVTLRCSSQAPNAQNLLRPDANPLSSAVSHWVINAGVLHVHQVGGPVVQLTASVYQDCLDPTNLEATAVALAERFDLLQFRSIVRAPHGYQLVSVDQAQVELRIAAALGQRAIAEAEKALSGDFVAPGWVVNALRRGDDYSIALDETAEGFDGFRDQLAATWRRVRQHGSPLAEVFRRGLDPHLLTGLAMAAREGIVDLAGRTPVEVLSDPATDVKALKGKLKQQRQNAKPANFGLLYGAQASTLWRLGVTDYGLDWSLEDATAVRALWLEQYADVRFWQLWVQLVHCSDKHDTLELYRRDRYTMELETKSYKIRTSRTLGGRPIYTPELREVLNHQDQSSGAEITTRAIVSMPEPARSYLCNAIHDELIAICPSEEAHAVGQQIRQAMRDAMDTLLAPWGIPSDADVGMGQFWAKD